MNNLQVLKCVQLEDVRSYSKNLLDNIYSKESRSAKNDDNFNLHYLQFVLFVLKDNIPLARLAVYENTFVRNAGNNALLVGNFECADDQALATMLFSAVEDYAQKNSYSSIIGPINGSTWDNYRLPLNSKFPRFFTEECFNDYYPAMFLINGFEVLAEYYSTVILDLKQDAEGNQQNTDSFFVERNLHVRRISKEQFMEDVELIYEFCMETFSSNYLFSPIPKAYFIEKYLPIKHLIDPEYCLLVFDDNNDLVSLFFCIPDILNKECKTLIVKTIARISDQRYAGISSVLLQRIISKAAQNGYEQIIHAFMHQKNSSLIISKKFHSEIIRTYQLYNKQLKK